MYFRWDARNWAGEPEKDGSKRRGVLITLEGIDGTGKTTQLRRLVRYLRGKGYTVAATREPGGTRVGEQVREIFLSSRNQALTPLAELALAYAARAQHLEEVIRPALARGEVVVSDRFNDSSRAYQGYGRKLGAETVEVFDIIICRPTEPDLTIVLDVDPDKSLSRAVRREVRQNSRHSRFEQAGLGFQRRARQGYRMLARQEPERVKIVRVGDRTVEDIQKEIRQIVDAFLAARTAEIKKPRVRRKNPKRAASITSL